MYYSLPLDELSSFTGKTVEVLKRFHYVNKHNTKPPGSQKEQEAGSNRRGHG